MTKHGDMEDIKIPFESKEKILKNIKNTITFYENNKENIKEIDLNIDDIKEESINSKINDVYINGVKGSIILKEMVLNAIDKQEKIENVVYKNDFYVNKENGPNVLTMGGGFYFYLLAYKDKIVIYELDNFFKINKKQAFNIDEVISFKVIIDDCCVKIITKGKNYNHTFFMFDFHKENLLKIEEALKGLEIKNLTGTKVTSKDKKKPVGYEFYRFVNYFYIVIIIIAIIAVIVHYIGGK